MEDKNFHSFFCISYKAEVDRHPKSMDDLFILESNPDIYYYAQHPSTEVKSTPYEHHLFVLTEKNECFQDNIFKFLYNLEQKTNKKLHIYPGQIAFGDELYMTLRFRETELEEALAFVDYLRHNLNMKFRKDRRFNRQQATIHYKKWIQLDLLQKDVYKDVHARNVYLVKLPAELSLDDFYTVVEALRNTHRFATFEPFYAYTLVSYYEVVPFLMIYSPNCDKKRMPEFKETLLREIERIS